MSKSITTNFLFNLLYTLSGLLFPIITFPYASRIMMAEGIGQVQYFTSIISYISLFTSIGIPVYAIREVARVRNDKIKLQQTTLEILLLHLLLTFFGYLLVFAMCSFVDRIQGYTSLFLLLSISLSFNVLGCEWFYKGIEDFKFIALRGLVIKFASVLFLFIFVRSSEDIYQYAIYTLFVSVGNNIFNFCKLRQYITIAEVNFSSLQILRHLRPSLHIFLLSIITSIYVNLDTVMLGTFADNTSVGYYTAASKLTHIVLGVTGALSSVMLPRLSNLIATSQIFEFNRLAQKSVDIILIVCLPMTAGLCVCSPYLIRILSGASFAPAILTLEILAPIVLMISLSNVMGMQILYPMGKERIVIQATAIGAILNVLVNYCLIRIFYQNGAAIATLMAETIVTLAMLFLGHHFIPISLFSKHTFQVLVATILMSISCIAIRFFDRVSSIWCFALIVIVGFLVFFSVMFIVRNEIWCTYFNRFLSKFYKK